MSVAIRAEGLGKRYVLGRAVDPHRTLREALVEAGAATVGQLRRLGRADGARARADEFWALRDVSFEVAQGEAVGLIGGNGAGKSTLLKLLSRITAPTAGRGEIRGRVGSLLEVGTGFHPDLTGRENVFLNGAILGMRRDEVARKFDEIVAFAEIARFIDTPVKRYSSGMYLRLAFAVAAHLEPEVLLVDEVLAVGDAAFQKKCLGKMGDVMEQGRTVVFVSHNLAAVQSLCARAVWLRDGQVVDDGPSGRVVSEYLRSAYTLATEQVWPDPATAPGDAGARLHRVRVRPRDGDPGAPITVRTPFVVEFEYWNTDPTAVLSPNFAVRDEHDLLLFDAWPPPPGVRGPTPAGLVRSTCEVPGDLLNDGLYRAVVGLSRDGGTVLNGAATLVFAIQDTDDHRYGWYGDWPGVVRPVLRWEMDLPP